jgi:hypothetical protein
LPKKDSRLLFHQPGSLAKLAITKFIISTSKPKRFRRSILVTIITKSSSSEKSKTREFKRSRK